MYWCNICKMFWYYSEFDDYGKDVRVVYHANIAFQSVSEKDCPDCSDHAE